MGFRDELAEDRVSGLTLRQATTVSPDTDLLRAIEEMKATSLGCAVIVDDSKAPVGLFTEHSMLKALVDRQALADRTVSEFQDPAFMVISTDQCVGDVWEAVSKKGTRFICVVDDDGQLVGVTGQRGIAEYLAEYFPGQTVSQRLGSKPWMQQREGA